MASTQSVTIPQGHGASFQLLILSFAAFFTCMTNAHAQRAERSQSAREVVRAIARKEMDRLLLLKPIVATRDDAAKQKVLKQVSEDFRSLQDLNNKMMADAWSQPELDYRYISEMISQIRSRATRLKTNLALPSPEGGQSINQTEAALSEPDKFRAALLQLDRHIMNFVANPLFQKPEVVEIELATRASRDLSVVVELSGRLKKASRRAL